jgi:hypothetical protein
LLISIFSISAHAESPATPEEATKKLENALQQTCEDNRGRILRRSECADEQAEFAKIECGEADTFRKSNELLDSCLKKRKYTKEEAKKMKNVLEKYRSYSHENKMTVNCEAFDEQGNSVATLNVPKKTCRSELEKKFKATNCKPGERSTHKYKYTNGAANKLNLTIFCKKAS